MTRLVGGAGLGALLVALIVAAAPVTGQEAPDEPSAEAARRGAEYLASRQGPDGAIPPSGPSPRPDVVAEALVALIAGGGQDGAVHRVLEYLALTARDGASNGPFTGRIVSGLVAAGEDPRDFAGTDFVALLQSYHQPNGSYGGNLYGDALAMLGLLAAGEDLPVSAVNRLVANQCQAGRHTGGWAWQDACLGGADTDTTALALSVLVEVQGPGGAAVTKARQWLLDTQNSSGCWGHHADAPDRGNSCGLVLSAVTALGEDVGEPPWTNGVWKPLERLRTFQHSSGGFKDLAEDTKPNDYATVQAVPGLAGWSYPVAPPPPDTGVSEPGDPGTARTTTTVASVTTTTRWASGAGDGRRAGPQAIDAVPPDAADPPTMSTAASVTTTTSTSGERAAAVRPDSRSRAGLDTPGSTVPSGVAVAIDRDRDRPMALATGIALATFLPTAAGAGFVLRRRLSLDEAMVVDTELERSDERG